MDYGEWGQIHREGLFDYGLGLGAILFAPIIETVFIFVPILEILRLFKIKPIWTILGFAMFFEALHTQRGFFEHLDSLSYYGVNDDVVYLNEKKNIFTCFTLYRSCA